MGKIVVMPRAMRSIPRALTFAAFPLIGCFAIQLMLLSAMNVWAGSSLSSKSAKAQGDAERGKAIFNGKGVCYYCHGVEGYLDRRPQLEADTAALIARLNPQPANLRSPSSLKLKTDKARFRAIREGHPGTGMFPDTTLTDREVKDLLAYLAVLRQQTSKETGKP